MVLAHSPDLGMEQNPVTGYVALVALRGIFPRAHRHPEVINWVKRYWQNFSQSDRQRLYWAAQGYIGESCYLIEDHRYRIFGDEDRLNESNRSLAIAEELSQWMESTGCLDT